MDIMDMKYVFLILRCNLEVFSRISKNSSSLR